MDFLGSGSSAFQVVHFGADKRIMEAGTVVDSHYGHSALYKVAFQVGGFYSYNIFEYIACGLPVICSYEQGGDNIGYVGDYNFGATVPPEDADALVNAILPVLTDGLYFTEDFVKRARWILRELDVTWDALVDQVEVLCQSATGLAH